MQKSTSFIKICLDLYFSNHIRLDGSKPGEGAVPSDSLCGTDGPRDCPSKLLVAVEKLVKALAWIKEAPFKGQEAGVLRSISFKERSFNISL